MKTEDDRKAKELSTYGLLSLIVGIMVAYTGAGVLLGWLAWEKLGWPWWVLLVTSLAGLTLAMVKISRLDQPRK